MRASYETYHNVAENCSKFAPLHEADSFSNSTQDMNTNVSCTNCVNFDNDKHCVLDLFDPIVKNNNY